METIEKFKSSRKFRRSALLRGSQPYNGSATHVIVNVRIGAVIKQGSFVHLLRLLGAIELDEDIASVDVGLRVVAPHGDGLPIEAVGLLQARHILRD